MVNYRRVLCEVALLSAFVMLVSSAPTPDTIHYDQRQNGTENYRVNIDGVVFAVVPAEPLFSALGDIDDLMDLLSVEDLNGLASLGSLGSKPPTSTTAGISGLEGEKPSVLKPQEKPTEEKPSEAKPSEAKPSEEKPSEQKPQDVKPLETKPEAPAKPAELPPLSDVSLSDDFNAQKKEVSSKKQEKTKRLKNRLAAFLMPLLRKTRHQ